MAEPTNDKTRNWRQLRELTELLNRDESFLDEDDTSLDTALQRQEREIVASLSDVGSLPETAVSTLELKSARHFRAGLVKLGTDKIVTESIQGARSDSGPLNPEKLVIHSLSVMRELSPRYLSRFVSYIDTLFWLEQAGTDNKQ